MKLFYHYQNNLAMKRMIHAKIITAIVFTRKLWMENGVLDNKETYFAIQKHNQKMTCLLDVLSSLFGAGSLLDKRGSLSFLFSLPPSSRSSCKGSWVMVISISVEEVFKCSSRKFLSTPALAVRLPCVEPDISFRLNEWIHEGSVLTLLHHHLFIWRVCRCR